MTRKLLLVILLSVVLFSPGAARADGDIYVGGPWGTRINSLPYTINAAGSYYLGGNLSYSGSYGITVASGINDVTIDLMGFTINGSGGVCAIYMSTSNNVEVRNGTLSGWSYGIYAGSGGTGHRIINVRLEGTNNGAMLYGSGHLIQGCRATAGSSSSTGLYIGANGRISGCMTTGFLDCGVEIDSQGIISNNVVIGPNNASYYYSGIYAGPASVVMGNEVTGATRGIYCVGGTSVIGNTVNIASGQYGITVPNATTSMLDQNTVIAASGGTPYVPAFNSVPYNVAKRNNY